MPSTIGLPDGKRVRIFDAYMELREDLHNGVLDAEEAMSVSDFPTYITTLVRHAFLARFTELQGQWTQYTRDFSVEDFEEYTSSRFGRLPDVPERAANSPYDQVALREYEAEKIILKEWGYGFAVTRRLILADRLNKIQELPGLAAEALARTMSKKAAVDAFQSNPTMYDGNALFSSAHGNYKTTALAASIAGADAVKAADLLFDDMTDDEGYPIVTPGGRTLIIPPELRYVAKAVNEQEQLLNASNYPQANEVRGLFTNIIIEPFFTDATNWYIAADPKGPFAFLAHINLNGNTTPFIGLKDPGVRGVLGGDDPYSFEFDEIEWKLRHDFNFKPVEWRGVVGCIVT
jgi:hypothetical protein